MPTTASRTASFTPQIIGASEVYMQNKVNDLFFEGNPYLYLLKKKGRIKSGMWNVKHVIPMRQTPSDLPVTYADLDTIDFVRPDGPEAAEFTYGQYVLGIPWSEVQEADNFGPGQNVNVLQGYIDQKIDTAMKEWNYDLIHGNSQDALKFVGLEQGVAPYNHATAYDADNFSFATRRAAARQAVNTYGGILRAVNAGTGWENVSVSLDESYNDAPQYAAGDSTFRFGTNQVKSPALKALDRVIMACSWHESRPDCILSTHQPFLDYCNAYSQTIQYVKTGAAQQDADLGLPHVMHGGCMWGIDVDAASSGLIGDATAGGDAVYVLTMSTWNLLMQTGWNFELRKWLDVPQQMARVSALKARGFHYTDDPRKNGVLHGYNQA